MREGTHLVCRAFPPSLCPTRVSPDRLIDPPTMTTLLLLHAHGAHAHAGSVSSTPQLTCPPTHFLRVSSHLRPHSSSSLTCTQCSYQASTHSTTHTHVSSPFPGSSLSPPPNILLCNGPMAMAMVMMERSRREAVAGLLNVFVVARNKCHQIRSNVQCNLCTFYVIHIFIVKVFIL